ncbi:twitching motility protein PilT [Picosynechococcus sp. PCC 7003]|uniref:type II toxin-antitoxin system VapC family toxin n=1 Tax=Picosynechococcus sp. PCC 7003 TaxID=374981 RepID=UPI000810DB57|nr:type II toxin-antitoxin system VapC family toxin [Picosynechococcus sp. PCC 7003]ANV83301.1 twitching motility protein PilT [Picosynechococcus sp. PCC 7003]
MKYLYDTNVFIDYFSGEPQVDPLFDFDFLQENTIILSTIVKIELLGYPNLSQQQFQEIKDSLAIFDLVFINPSVETQTIQLRQQHKIKLPDAIIASTCLTENAILVTRNVNDFKNISSLEVINPFANQ